MRKIHSIDQEQKYRIQRLLAQRQDARGRPLKMTDLAKALGELYANVANTIYNTRPGTKKTRELQVRIAEFLEAPVAELFGANALGEIPPDPPLNKGGRTGPPTPS